MKTGMSSLILSSCIRQIMSAGHKNVVDDPKGEASASHYRGRSLGMCQVVGLAGPPVFCSESHRLECVAAILKGQQENMTCQR